MLPLLLRITPPRHHVPQTRSRKMGVHLWRWKSANGFDGELHCFKFVAFVASRKSKIASS